MAIATEYFENINENVADERMLEDPYHIVLLAVAEVPRMQRQPHLRTSETAFCHQANLLVIVCAIVNT